MEIRVYREEEVEDFFEHLASLRAREDKTVEMTARRVLNDVRKRGDQALLDSSRRFDDVRLATDAIRVKPEEIAQGAEKVPEEVKESLRGAAANIRRFHEKQRRESWMTWEENGVVLGQRVQPIRRVGLYVPGGRAPYPSTLLMLAIPAQVAGVDEIAVCSAPTSDGDIHPLVLCVAEMLDLTELYRLGGAQAIAALAYGTETVAPVDKIFGPGNAYVTMAKKLVFGVVGVDMLAGPSEIVILADDSADPAYIAADLLAQSEHDPMCMSLLVTACGWLAESVAEEMQHRLGALPRRQIIEMSISSRGGILLGNNLDQCIEWVNRIAPEHLGIYLPEAWTAVQRIHNAGSIFLGSYSPEAVGDYWAGPNHVLPTLGNARFASALGVDDFVVRSNIIAFSKSALREQGSHIAALARAEGLEAHAVSVEVRSDAGN